MQVCRSAGYYRHALEVAQAAQQSEVYLDILIEDCKEWDEALAYLQNVPRKEAAAVLQKYGKVRNLVFCEIPPIVFGNGMEAFRSRTVHRQLIVLCICW